MDSPSLAPGQDPTTVEPGNPANFIPLDPAGTMSYWDPRTFDRTYLTWMTETAFDWATTTFVRDWLQPFSLRHVPETDAQQNANTALQGLANRADVLLEDMIWIMTSVPLDKMHKLGDWMRCSLILAYEAGRRRDRRTTSNADGPAGDVDSNKALSTGGTSQPDRAVSWAKTRDPSEYHATLQVEFKVFKGDADCKDKHRQGFAQVIAYLMAAFELCRTRIALLVLNGFFHRLIILPGSETPLGTGATDVHHTLYVEVHEESPLRGVWQDDQQPMSNEYFGKEFLINEMVYKAQYQPDDTAPGTPIGRYWQCLVLSLKLASQYCAGHVCPRDDPSTDMSIDSALLDGLVQSSVFVNDTETAYLTHACLTETGKRTSRKDTLRGTESAGPSSRRRTPSPPAGGDEGSGPAKKRAKTRDAGGANRSSRQSGAGGSGRASAATQNDGGNDEAGGGGGGSEEGNAGRSLHQRSSVSL